MAGGRGDRAAFPDYRRAGRGAEGAAVGRRRRAGGGERAAASGSRGPGRAGPRRGARSRTAAAAPGYFDASARRVKSAIAAASESGWSLMIRWPLSGMRRDAAPAMPSRPRSRATVAHDSVSAQLREEPT